MLANEGDDSVTDDGGAESVIDAAATGETGEVISITLDMELCRVDIVQLDEVTVEGVNDLLDWVDLLMIS